MIKGPEFGAFCISWYIQYFRLLSCIPVWFPELVAMVFQVESPIPISSKQEKDNGLFVIHFGGIQFSLNCFSLPFYRDGSARRWKIVGAGGNRLASLFYLVWLDFHH